MSTNSEQGCCDQVGRRTAARLRSSGGLQQGEVFMEWAQGSGGLLDESLYLEALLAACWLERTLAAPRLTARPCKQSTAPSRTAADFLSCNCAGTKGPR